MLTSFQGAFFKYYKQCGHCQIKPNDTTAELKQFRFIYIKSTVGKISYNLDPDSFFFSKTLKLLVFVKNLERSSGINNNKIIKPLTSLSSDVLSASLMFMLYKKN